MRRTAADHLKRTFEQRSRCDRRRLARRIKGRESAMPHRELAEFTKLGLTPQQVADLIAEKQAAPELLDKILAQHEAAAAAKITTLEKELAYARAVERELVP